MQHSSPSISPPTKLHSAAAAQISVLGVRNRELRSIYTASGPASVARLPQGTRASSHIPLVRHCEKTSPLAPTKSQRLLLSPVLHLSLSSLQGLSPNWLCFLRASRCLFWRLAWQFITCEACRTVPVESCRSSSAKPGTTWHRYDRPANRPQSNRPKATFSSNPPSSAKSCIGRLLDGFALLLFL